MTTLLDTFRAHLSDQVGLELSPVVRRLLDSAARWGAECNAATCEDKEYARLCMLVQQLAEASRNAAILGMRLSEFDEDWSDHEVKVLLCAMDPSLRSNNDMPALDRAIDRLRATCCIYAKSLRNKGRTRR